MLKKFKFYHKIMQDVCCCFEQGKRKRTAGCKVADAETENNGKMERRTMKKGIIFDMDGTLWDSAEGIAESWSQVIAEEYAPDCVITVEDIHRVMGKTMDDIAQILFPELTKEKRSGLLASCCEAENAYLRAHGGVLYQGLEDTWKKLKESYPLYIVSNCQSGYIEAFLDYYGLWEFIEDRECFGNTGVDKGENIRKVVERSHLTDAVYVGDIQGDYDASRKAGVRFIHAAYGFGTIHTAVPAIHSLQELPKAVEEIFGSARE